MGLTFTPESKPPTAAAPTPAPEPVQDDRGPLFQPADHLFPYELGDGIRNALPLDLVPSWSRPETDLSFDLRQITIAENCRAYRMADAKSPGTDTPWTAVHREQFGNAIRRIGDTQNPGDAFVDQWIEDIGFQGWHFVWSQFSVMHMVTIWAMKKFDASERRDVANRRTSYTLPGQCLPRKRWAARMRAECKWVHEVDEETLVDSSHWTVDGKPAEVDVADRLSRDLTFTIAELKQGDHTIIADLVEDPDDKSATRVMEVMYSLVSIGGRALTNTPPDLAIKRAWLEDIGPRGQKLVTGVWVKMHEVDHAKMATFLDAATPLD